MIPEHLRDRRLCYFVLPNVTNERGEYRALIAVENESGYFLTDWTWSKDIKIAELCAKQKNEALGLTEQEAFKIQFSTMFKTVGK